ncbi:hypothetical protein O6H91_Y555400 [Diphasiastrum complanatum]|nr:hypothetical protein O6H91_Y555400 [Diphasiastrum complanatum]
MLDEEMGAAADEDDESEEEIDEFGSNRAAVPVVKEFEEEADSEQDEEDEAVEAERHKRMVADVTGKPMKSKKEKRKRDYVVSEAYPESEYNVNPSIARTNGATNLHGITVEDLMASLQGTAGFGALKKKMRGRLHPKAPVQVPLPRIIQEKIERKAGYEKTKEEISNWQPIIKKNREAATLVFNQRTNFSTPSTAALAASFKPTTDFEKEIAGLLQESRLHNVKEIEAAESLALNKLTVEEVRERQERLAKMRSLLFQHEARAKRIKKIKSKTFHRLFQKSEKRKAGANMFETDPEARQDEALKQEYKRAQERMTLKHKNTSRWAKRILERGLKAHSDDGTRDAIAEQLRAHRQLTRKMHSATGSSSDDDTASEDDDDENVQNGENGLVLEKKSGSKILAKAKVATLKFLEGDEEAEIPNTGLFALPFMSRAIEKKRKEAQSEAIAVLDQLDQVEADGTFSLNDGERNGSGMGRKEVTGMLRFGDMKSSNIFLQTGKSEKSEIDDLLEEQSASEDDTIEDEVNVGEKSKRVLSASGKYGKTVDVAQLPTEAILLMGSADDEPDGMAFMTIGHVTQMKAPVSVDLTGSQTKNRVSEGSSTVSQPSANANTGCFGPLSDEFRNDVIGKSAAGINPVLFGDIDRKVYGIDLPTDVNDPSARSLSEAEKKKKKCRRKKKTKGSIVNEVSTSDALKVSDGMPTNVSIAGNLKQVLKTGDISCKAEDRSAILEASRFESIPAAFDSTNGSFQNVEGSDDEEVGDQNAQLLDGIGSQEDLVRRAFAGDNVEAEFEEAKLHTLDEEVPAVQGSISLPGWGQWTSIQQKHGPPLWMLKEEESQKKSREAALSKRKDAKLKYVIISEKMDRKADKFMSSSLPFPYKSREVFEKTLRMPIGRDFNTDEAFRNMIRPAEIKSAGIIIEPIMYEKSRRDGKHLESHGRTPKQKQKRGRVGLEASKEKQRSKRPKSET